jgi:glycine cleavage system P protein (glycine dehydrogenase) subunit 2
MDNEPLLFELSRPGCSGFAPPECDVPVPPAAQWLPPDALAQGPLPLPELAEADLVRHFTRLSQLNMCVDTNFYPLGSCTMKYNPKRNEEAARLPGFAHLHPYLPDRQSQGVLELLWHVQQFLGEIAGLPAVSLQPAAGAHGELTSLMAVTAYFKDRGEQRTKVLIPDTAHGTNSSSAAIAGLHAVEIRSGPDGLVDLADLEAKLDDDTAVLMITNPNTLGLFDHQIAAIADRLHQAGGLVYMDGANMNAIMGLVRPGDCGVDLMHYNPHKTFSGPHGAGGPGSGPIAVTEALGAFLPVPLVEKGEQGYFLQYDRPKSIGRVRSFVANVGVLVRAYSYLRTLGPEGIRATSQNAVLNANYLLSLLADHFETPFKQGAMHEFVLSAKALGKTGVRAMDLAKRLLDFGFHAPTVYFPLIVAEALMIEPTETESRQTLEAFAETLVRITGEDPELLHTAPHRTCVSRPDEVAAARKPVLRWQSSGG